MKKILVINKLSGNSFIIKIRGKKYNCDSWDELSRFITNEIIEILWPEGNKSPNSCILTIEEN